MKNQRKRRLLLALLSLAIVSFHAGAPAATKEPSKPSFADILIKIQDGQNDQIYKDLLEMAPHLSDRQKDQIRSAVRSQEEHTLFDHSLLYLAGFAEHGDQVNLILLFGAGFVRIGLSLGDKMLHDTFPSHSMGIAGLEAFELDRDALQKLRDQYLAHDQAIIAAIDEAEAISRKTKLPAENRRLTKLFFKRLRNEGFRRYQDKCDESLN